MQIYPVKSGIGIARVPETVAHQGKSRVLTSFICRLTCLYRNVDLDHRFDDLNNPSPVRTVDICSLAGRTKMIAIDQTPFQGEFHAP